MKFLSLVLKIFLGFIVVSVIAIGAIIALVDPNDYRDQITQVVKNETGRDLHIESISLAFFPQIGIKLSNTKLSNAQGFGDQPFLEVANVQIGATILPLLSQRLEIDTLTLHGLKLNLAKNTEGITNWDDLIKPSPVPQESKQQTTPPATENTLAKLASLNFGGIDIKDGRIYWQDQQAKQNIELTIHDFNTGAITFGKFFHIYLQVDANIANPELQTATTLKIEAKLEQDGSYQLRNLVLKTTATGKGIPLEQAATKLTVPTINLELAKNKLSLPSLILEYRVIGDKDFPVETLNGELTLFDFTGDLSTQAFQAKKLYFTTNLTGESSVNNKSQIKLSTQPSINLTTQTAELNNLTIEKFNSKLQGFVKATHITSNPLVQAQVDIPQTDLRYLLSQLNITLPEMADATTLSKFSASLGMKFDAEKQALNINNLKLNLDDTKLTGSVAVSQFDRPNISYNLALTTIDLNRYLPPKKEQPDEEKTASTAETAIVLPTELLRSLIINGTFKANSIIFDNLKPQNIILTIKGTEGNIKANPIQADIFATKIRAQVGLDVRGDTPLYSFKVDSKNIPIGEVLLAFTEKDQITGTGAVSVDITTAGSKVSHFKQNLNGTISFDLKDGAVKGFNLAQSIRQARAKIGGKTFDKSDKNLQTDFSTLTGQFLIKQGVVDTQKLLAKAPFMRISGTGQINLPKESLDYLVKVKIVGTDKGQGGQELKELFGLTIPVKVQGSWLKPDVSLDLKSIFEQKASAEITKKKQELKDKVKQKEQELKAKAEQEKQQAIDDAKTKIEDKLKESIFKGFGL